MILHTEHKQGSLEWMGLRVGVATASEFDRLISPEGKIRTGKMPHTYLHFKAAEWWVNTPLGDNSTWDMEQGQILETEARPWYEFKADETVTEVSFITTDDKRVGCSPDGLIGDDGGIEIKCPSLETHAGYLLDGVLPKDYIAQVQGALYVTGRKWWKFLSYNRKMPPLLLTIEPNPEFQQALAAALGNFLNRFDNAKARLTELNGGPPRRFTQKQQPVRETAPFDLG